jgi:CheY-like chemotaxis protein
MGGSVQVLAPSLPLATAAASASTSKSHRAPGIGNVFEVRLPAAPRADADAAPKASPSRRRQVLYIEDNPVNALIVCELLSRRQDIELHLAEDGAGGVAAAEKVQPDLVMIDMQLPDMDGLQVLQALRAQPSTAHLRCVALSANAMPDDMQQARDAGMIDYWTKPLDFGVFLSALDRVLGPTG